MTTQIDLSGLKALQGAYDAQGDTPLTQGTLSTHVNGKEIQTSEQIQKTVNTELLSGIEQDILTSFPLRNQVAYFKETVHAYLESLGASPKPITARDISTIVGYLIADLDEGSGSQTNAQHPLTALSESAKQSVLSHPEDYPDPVLRASLLAKLSVRSGANPLLTKLAQASQKEHQNIILNEYRSLANRQMFRDMSLKSFPTLNEEKRAELAERASTRYEDLEQRKAFTKLMNAGKPAAEELDMNAPQVLTAYKDHCLLEANNGMQKILTTLPVAPSVPATPVNSAGPTGTDVAPGSVYCQGSNTCFMVSVANALASTQSGAAYLANWISEHPLSQSDTRFSAFENTLGTIYQQADPQWHLGSIGIGPDAASRMGLDNTDNTVILAPPGMSTWQHRDLWVNTSERLAHGEVAILFTDAPKHYRTVVGTWGDPKGEPGKDFGFVVRDSITQSDKRVTMGELMSAPPVFSNNLLGQTDPTQISFFKLPEAEPKAS